MKARNLPKLLTVIGALLLGYPIVTISIAQAADPGGQKAAASGSAQTTAKSQGEIPEAADLNLPAGEMQTAVERYGLDRTSLMRSYPADLSPARRSRMRQFYTRWKDALAKRNFEAMGQIGQVDYLLFKNHLEYELRQLDTQEKLLAEAAPLMPFAQAISDLEEARRRMEWIDPAKAAAQLTSLNKQVETVRKSVEAGLRPETRPESKTKGDGEIKIEPVKVKKPVANRAAANLNSLRNTLRNWYTFYNGYDPLFTWWMETPYKTLDKTLQDYSTFLRERIVGVKVQQGETVGSAPSPGFQPGGRTPGEPPAGAQFPPGAGARGARGGVQVEAGSSADIIGDPIGRDALANELAHELIPYTPEELIALANKEMEWCENEMKKASRELGYGDDWMKALEHVKSLYVEPGKQPELIRELAVEAIKFIDDHNLVTVPPLARESWRMEMMSLERQLVNPFFTGGEVISVSYPTNAMSHEQKMMSMRGNNIHFARATVFHELIPGHHLQGFMASRYRAYRGIFSTPFLTEGWALHWEMLLWDMGFPRSPENRIGMLFWRMHRCARIIFSLSFHLEKMTPQECIDFLVKRVGHEVENATGEVRRSFDGSYPPLYQAAYLLGGLQIRALHRELVDSGKMADRAFHDAILRENRIPIELLRSSLTKQKLGRDFVSSWKFYGNITGSADER